MKLIVSGWDFPPLSLLVWKHSVYHKKNLEIDLIKIANNIKNNSFSADFGKKWKFPGDTCTGNPFSLIYLWKLQG